MSGRIPSGFIDDLLARTDLVEVIDARVPLRRAGKDYQACCPFHDERTPSFTVSPTKQFYHCFGCGAHGSAIGFLMQYEHMSFPEAVAMLASRAGMPLPEDASRAQASANAFDALSAVLARARDLYRRELKGPRGSEALAYLRGRGISDASIDTFALGFAPDDWHVLKALGTEPHLRDQLAETGLLIRREGKEYDRFRGRLMIPIDDYRGRIIGFGGRIIASGEPKYLNSPETPLFHKGRELFGLHQARDAIKSANHVIVVEGYLDVVALAQHGVGAVVATLGTALSAAQLERLYRFAPEIVLCFDGDRAGQAAASRSLETAMPVLSDGRQLSFLFLPEKDDPDSFVRREGQAAFMARFAAREGLPEFFFRTLESRTDMARLDGRAKLAELARPLLSKLETGVLRSLMVSELGKRVGIPPAAVTADWGAPVRAPAPPPRPGHGVGKRLGPAKLALTLLVQRPALAASARPSQALETSERPILRLIARVLTDLRDRPASTTAQVLERYAGTDLAEPLVQCAEANHIAIAHETGEGFAALVARLEREAWQAALRALYARAGGAPLTGADAAEVSRLSALLRNADPSVAGAASNGGPGNGGI